MKDGNVLKVLSKNNNNNNSKKRIFMEYSKGVLLHATNLFYKGIYGSYSLACENSTILLQNKEMNK